MKGVKRNLEKSGFSRKAFVLFKKDVMSYLHFLDSNIKSAL